MDNYYPIQAPRKQTLSDIFFYQPVQEPDAYNWPRSSACSDGGSNGLYSVQNFDQYCNLESTASFSPNGSPVSQPNSCSYPSDLHQSPDIACGSPVSGSCVTNNEHDLKHMIIQLETAMLGPDSDNIDMHNMITTDGTSQMSTVEAEKRKYMVEMISRGDLKEVLCACAKCIENDDMLAAEWLMTQLRQMVSVSGEPIQRLGAYMMEGLVARLVSSGSSIYNALRCKEPVSLELLSYMHILYEVCPYFKFGYMSANGAIAEAMKDESSIHIIDFQIVQGTQWMTLIQASLLALRPPRIRITGIDDPTSAYARGVGLEIVGQRLCRLAESCKVPLEFHAAAISGTEVQVENLGIRAGEAIAVNFALMLHHMPDESVGTNNHRDRLLRLAKSISPKVVTLVEQEANTNTAPFFYRFVETLNHYLAIFESVDVILPRDHKERVNVEQHCLAREVVNIIACEGPERVERHELLGKWRSRFTMAGFRPYPLSSFVNGTIKTLLQNYNEKYTLEERDAALYLGWMNRPIISSCAWKC